MKFKILKIITILLLFLLNIFLLLVNNNIINTPYFIYIYLFMVQFMVIFVIFLIIVLIYYIIKKISLIKFMFFFFIIILSNINILYLSSETDFPGTGGGPGAGLNGAITLIIVLLGGAIGMVYQLHKISKIPPKFSTPKPKIEGSEPTSSKLFDVKDESVPEILKLVDRINRGELNPPKPPEIPIRTPFEKALGDFCDHLAIFTAFLFLLYVFYSRDVLGFREYILHVKSKINKKHIIWKYRFYIILTFQFCVTILILFL